MTFRSLAAPTRRAVLGVAAAPVLAALVERPASAAARGVRLQRIVMDQGEVWIVTPRGTGGRRLPLAVYHHGASQTARSTLASKQGSLIRDLALAGYCVAVSDFGGNLWGNELNHAYITALIDRLQVSLAWRGRVTLIGSSMGGGAVLSYAGRFPGRVASVVALQPVVDLGAMKRRGYFIDRRFDGDYADPVHGAEHSPVVQASKTPGDRGGLRSFDGTPIMVVYGTRDGVVPAREVRKFARRVQRGFAPRLKMRQVRGAGHGGALFRRTDPQMIVRFVDDHRRRP